MPYIQQEDRDAFVNVEKALQETKINTPGELQFLIALLIKEYFYGKEYRYQTMNDIMGALSGANQEFYRRYVAPYEDGCISRNGDVKYERNIFREDLARVWSKDTENT